MPTHRGEVRELQRPPLWAGDCLPEEEDGPRRCKGVEVSLPHVEAARHNLEARRATRRDPGDTGGWDGGGEDGQTHVGRPYNFLTLFSSVAALKDE